jgi:hypothetical protein
MDYPHGFEWMQQMITILPVEIEARNLRLTLKFQPRRSVHTGLAVVVENPLRQKWRFGFDVAIDRAGLTRILNIESSLNIATSKKIKNQEPIPRRCEFRAYFDVGSPTEFSVVPASGILEMSLNPDIEFPFDVVFKPQVYEKMTKALLIVETDEVEFLFEGHGQLLEYAPPKIERSGVLDVSMPETGVRRSARRHCVRENVDSVRGKPAKQKMRVVKVKHADGISPFAGQMGAESQRRIHPGFVGADEDFT